MARKALADALTYYTETLTALTTGTQTATILAQYADLMRAKAAMPGCSRRLAEELACGADAVFQGIYDHTHRTT